MTTYEEIKAHLKANYTTLAELAMLSKRHPRNLGRTIKTTIERLNKILKPAGLEISVKRVKKYK